MIFKYKFLSYVNVIELHVPVYHEQKIFKTGAGELEGAPTFH